MLKNIFAIAKNTFRETIRDRILLSAFMVILGMILFSLFIASISLEQSTRMILDFSMTAIYALQIFIAIFMGSMLMYKEIERKTFFLILPKPIKTGEIIIGKSLGLTAASVIVTLISTIALFIILILNQEKTLFALISLSLFLSTLESILLILLSLLFSGITSPVLSAVFTFSLFLVGHSTNILKTIFINNDTPFVTKYVAEAAYYILPNLEKFNIRNEIMTNALPDHHLVILTLIYAFCYGLLLYIFAQLMFKSKDF